MRLYLVFEDDAGGEFAIRINDPREDLQAGEVMAMMNGIIASGVVDAKGKDLADIKSAYTIEEIKTSVV